jgi:hypothetical protein
MKTESVEPEDQSAFSTVNGLATAVGALEKTEENLTGGAATGSARDKATLSFTCEVTVAATFAIAEEGVTEFFLGFRACSFTDGVLEETEVRLAELFDRFFSKNSICCFKGITTAVLSFRCFPILSHANQNHHPPKGKVEDNLREVRRKRETLI